MTSCVTRVARHRRSALVALCAAAWLATACSDGLDTVAPPEETPGTLTIHWFTPHNVEGAVRLTIEGPGIRAIAAAQGDAVVFTRSEGSRHNVAVLGRTDTGGLVRFDVPDTGRLDLYRVTLVEVADLEAGNLREDLDDYRITIE